MKIVADLQLHSKYSRAVSQKMDLSEIATWADVKGIDLVSTGDFTHPLHFRQISSCLEEVSKGLFRLKKSAVRSQSEDLSPLFILGAEVSSIYTQADRQRRTHNMIFAPSLTTAEKINEELTKRGCNLLSDGRPIIGLSSIELCEVVFGVDERCLIVPAHCLLPTTPVHMDTGTKPISEIEEGERVLTHRGRFRKVEKVYTRFYKGKIYSIKLWNFSLGLTTTDEHPFFAIKTVKECRSTGDICRPVGKHIKHCTVKHYKSYRPEWILAEKLEKGDLLIYPRFQQVVERKSIYISDFVGEFESNNGLIEIEASRYTKIKDEILVNKSFCRFIGYYLAEGYIDSKGGISFAFSAREREYIEDVKQLMQEVFGLNNPREYKRNNHRGVELIYYSKIASLFLTKLCYKEKAFNYNAAAKCFPNFFLSLPKELQVEAFKGWWRGDRGYTSSRELMNQLKIILLRLGIIPSIIVDKVSEHRSRGKHRISGRRVKAKHDNYNMTGLSFLSDPFGLLAEKEFSQFKTKMSRRHGWMDEDYVYLPIRDIEMNNYEGDVYNLEVQQDNSYVTEFACVHNCWTPWYSLYGSKSGFNSLEECFGKYADYIYAIETGLSSDPAMNWRIKELDNRAIISSSDAHSGQKLGREATIFEIPGKTRDNVRRLDDSTPEVKQPTYSDIYDAIKTANYSDKTKPRIAGTIEFYPEEGKYHYTGHRNCKVRYSPEETRKRGTTCPVCGNPLTVGVMHRVEELAGAKFKIQNSKFKIDKSGVRWIFHPQNKKPPYVMLVPLFEILAESLGGTMYSQSVKDEYQKLISNFGNEFTVLLKADVDDIARVSGEKVKDAISRVRSGDISVEPGYDGVFGKVNIWQEEEEKKEEKEQLSLF